MPEYVTCPTCDGSGSVYATSVAGQGNWFVECPTCHHTGLLIYEPTLAENEWIANDVDYGHDQA